MRNEPCSGTVSMNISVNNILDWATLPTARSVGSVPVGLLRRTHRHTQTHTYTHIHTHTQTHTVWRSLKSHQMEIWRKAFNSLATVRAFLSLNVARPAPLAVLAAPITRSLTTANDALWRRPEVASAPLFDEFRRFSFTFNIPALNRNNTN